MPPSTAHVDTPAFFDPASLSGLWSSLSLLGAAAALLLGYVLPC